MPWIIDYSLVLEQMRQQHCRCLYHNSGAFGFAPPAKALTAGWIGPEDSTLTPQARTISQQIAEPYAARLTQGVLDLWRDRLPGRLWVMPMSHWAYEMDYGSVNWLPQTLEQIGIDPGLLAGRNNGSALEFANHETIGASLVISLLLQRLHSSDFMIAFPNRPVLCMVHHHTQLWWSTTDESLHQALRQWPTLAQPAVDPSVL